MRQGPTVTILHTNDFHNHLTAVQSQFIQAQKAKSGPNTLLLDAGDAISAGNVGVRLGGEPILRTMNEIGYDAMTLGNREFHVADSLLRHKIGNAEFPILCANIKFQKEGENPLPVLPFFKKTLPNGLRVVVVGVTVPMVTTRMTARVISSYVFEDPIEIVSQLVKELRPTADLLIALTHIGYKEDRRLAEACPELDLIVGGHTHVVLESAEAVGKVPIVQAGWFGHYLGHVDLTFTDQGVSIIRSSLTDLRDLKHS